MVSVTLKQFTNRSQIHICSFLKKEVDLPFAFFLRSAVLFIEKQKKNSTDCNEIQNTDRWTRTIHEYNMFMTSIISLPVTTVMDKGSYIKISCRDFINYRSMIWITECICHTIYLKIVRKITIKEAVIQTSHTTCYIIKIEIFFLIKFETTTFHNLEQHAYY